LGSVTNVRWGDDDVNNSVQLKRSIEDLQQMLINFTTLKGKKYGIKINETEGANLLTRYNCRTAINHKNAKKILSAALQRLTLETLFNEIEQYFKQKTKSSKDQTSTTPTSTTTTSNNNNSGSGDLKPKDPVDDVERDIIAYTYRLNYYIDKFRNHRQGTDDLTRITPIKIRQQVYAILGIRGFIKKHEAIPSTKSSNDDNNEAIESPPTSNEHSHYFIDSLVKKCLNIMAMHREIKYDAKMEQQYREETEAMVIEVVHLYLRLHTQEPIPEFRKFFSSGEEIHASLMSGPEVADDDSGEQVVEICSFPLIATQGNKVLCKAQVETRPVSTSFWKK
ncbi:6604_t:CDS:1, partial [Ambispora leptoticha]